jgi:hypothetical protein
LITSRARERSTGPTCAAPETATSSDGILADDVTLSSPVDIGLDRRDISSAAGPAPVNVNSSSSCVWSKLARK